MGTLVEANAGIDALSDSKPEVVPRQNLKRLRKAKTDDVSLSVSPTADNVL